MSRDLAISIQGVAKSFDPPHERVGSLKAMFANPIRYVRKSRKSGKKRVVLRNIDIEIKKGEFFGIVGRNGSGKSTLLKLIAAIYQPTKGKVTIHGRLVPFIELGVGFNVELSGRDNIYLNGALLGFTKKEIDQKYDEIVEFAELDGFMDEKLKNYSSGMQVRLSFSVATKLAESDILLVDEVLAVGDASFQRKCFDYFKKIKREGKTVVFVSHDMGAIREYCERAVLVENSRIIKSGTADEIASEYSKLFIEKYAAGPVATQEKRWGDLCVKVRQIKCDVQGVDSEHVVISYGVRSNMHTEEVNMGFTIRNREGVAIAGTNTIISGLKAIDLEADCTATVTWKVPNIFNDGLYTVDVAVVYKSGRIADWWESASTFNVTRSASTPYLVNPKAECSLLVGAGRAKRN